MSETTLYKALKDGGTSPYQGHEWPLPSENGDGWEPGEWVDAGEGELVECEHGLHACTVEQLPRWLNDRLYVLEPAPGTDRLEGDDKTVVRRARLVRPVVTWSKTTARLFAADCAEMVLPIWEDKHPGDDRPREAIDTARDHARGGATDEELAAAGAAARTAARDAAWAAAWAAAGDAAWAAAGAAARTAARTAAGDAAGDVIADRLALYLEQGEAAFEEPVPDIRELITTGDTDE